VLQRLLWGQRMKKLNGLLLAGVILWLAAPPALGQMAQQAQPAPQIATTAPASADTVTTSAVLSATETWRPIAADLRTGGRLQITATGQWRIIQQVNFSNDIAAYQSLARDRGPDGYTDMPLNAEVVLPTAPIGALIGKIGENGAPFLIGSQYDQPITSDGALFVTINDIPTQLAENSGRLAIQVSVTPPPPPPPQPQPPPQPPQQPSISPDLIRAGVIGAAILVGLLLIASFSRPRTPRSDPNDRRNPAVPQVTARVANDGVAGQSLTLTIRGR
jgi:hypothetical protein